MPKSRVRRKVLAKGWAVRWPQGNLPAIATKSGLKS